VAGGSAALCCVAAVAGLAGCGAWGVTGAASPGKTIAGRVGAQAEYTRKTASDDVTTRARFMRSIEKDGEVPHGQVPAQLPFAQYVPLPPVQYAPVPPLHVPPAVHTHGVPLHESRPAVAMSVALSASQVSAS
jgi:hypothetical protein